MVLYNKYRPRDWDSVIGQEYITTILRNSIESDRVHHAYLFHGSRGTGKTTSARILAKTINCLNPKNGNPCHECIHCKAFENETMLDVIEIDGASNNGVEHVRDLIEKARFEPNQGKYKIYIIDEVHMLSKDAFNALLKTLEQPPSHVKFILATTEIDKVLETVRSRTLRFDFRKITQEDIITRLRFVCEAEKIDMEEEALKIIAKNARGGLRDALTLLEQNIIDGKVSTEHVRYTLALVEETLIDACLEALRAHDLEQIQIILENLREKHIEARGFFDQMLYRVRDFMIEHVQDPLFYTYSEILEMLESAYGKIRSIPDGMMLIEITLLRIVRRGGDTHASVGKSEQSLPLKSQKIETPKEITKPKKEEPKNPPPLTPDKQTTQDELSIPPSPPVSSNPPSLHPTNQLSHQPTIPPSSFSYPDLINHLKKHQIALTTDLKMARYQIDGDTLTLLFSKKWNHDRVNTSEKRNAIAESLTSLYGGSWSVKCTLAEASSGLSHAVDEVF